MLMDLLSMQVPQLDHVLMHILSSGTKSHIAIAIVSTSDLALHIWVPN